MAANCHHHWRKPICRLSRLRDVRERQPWPKRMRIPERQAQQGWRSRPCCPNDQCRPCLRRAARDRLCRHDSPAGQLGHLGSTEQSHLLPHNPPGVCHHLLTSSSGPFQRSAGPHREGRQQTLQLMFRPRSLSRLGLARPRLMRQQRTVRHSRRLHVLFVETFRGRTASRHSIRRQPLTVVIPWDIWQAYYAGLSLHQRTKLGRYSPGVIII